MNLEELKQNENFAQGLQLMTTGLAESIQADLTKQFADYYAITGATEILRGIITCLSEVKDFEEFKNNFESFLFSVGVKRIETTDNTLNIGPNSAQRIMDVYDDPEDNNLITSIKPGYILKTGNGDIILQYEDIKINESHYDNPIDLIKKNGKVE